MSIAERVLGTWRVQNQSTEWAVGSASTKGNWGWFPAFTLITAVGLLLIAIAYTASRMEMAWALPLFWLGYVGVLGMPVVRLLSTEATRGERIGLVILLGMSFYLLKIMYSPALFRMSDELQHWRTTSDILNSGQLFTENSILPVSPFFPGLENITAALITLSNLSIFQAGVLVIALARILLIVSLYLFYEEISQSAQIASLGTLFYFANPHFVFFDAQFSYQSLALPLAIFVLYLLQRREREVGYALFMVNLALILGVGAVIATHHVTALVLLGFLAIWALLSWQQHNRAPQSDLKGITMIALTTALAWLSYMAPSFFNYIRPWVTGLAREIMQLLTLEATPRTLFTSSSGQVATVAVQMISVLSVLFIIAALPIGIRKIWRSQRTNSITVTLLIGALLFPAFQFLRFTPAGLGIATRSNSHLFVGVGYVLAVAAVEVVNAQRSKQWGQLWVTGWAMVIFIGTMAATLAAWPLPGAYIAGNYVRSINQERVMAAEWTKEQLGPDNHFAAPMAHPNNFLLGSYGNQRVITHMADGAWLEPLFQEPTFTGLHKRILQKWQITFLLTDSTLMDTAPFSATTTLSQAESMNNTSRESAQQTKFDGLTRANRIYDSGDIIIYDTGVYAYE